MRVQRARLPTAATTATVFAVMGEKDRHRETGMCSVLGGPH